MATDDLSLAGKLAAISGAMTRVPKTGRHPQGWHFATEADISDAIRPHLAKHGIAIIPNLKEHTATPVGDQSRGGTRHTVVVEYTITDGTSERVVSWSGEADDWSDKGLNKAMTACRKYFLINLFMIATGDEEADASEGIAWTPPAGSETQQVRPAGGGYGSGPRDPNRPASDKQRGLVGARARAAGLSDENLEQLIMSETGGGMSHLTMGDVDRVLQAIQHFANTGELPAPAQATTPEARRASFDVVRLGQERYERLVELGAEGGVEKARVNEILRAVGVNDMKSLVNAQDPDDMSIFDNCKNLIQAESIKF